MACDACMWYWKRYGGWTNPVRLLILVQLAFVLVQSSAAIAQPDAFYYDYDVPSRGRSFTNDETMASHVFHTTDLDGAVPSRIRRAVGREPPDRTFHDTNGEHPTTGIHESNGSVNVTNSTDAVTATNVSTLKPVEQPNPHRGDVTTESTVSVEPDTRTTKPAKNTTVVVSNPMNAATGKSDETDDERVYTVSQIHVWANQTRWANATHESDEKSGKNSTIAEANPATGQPVDGGTRVKPEIEQSKPEKFDGTMKNATSIGQSTNSSDADIDEFSDRPTDKFPDVTNNTLVNHNITKTEEDTHQYYNSTFFSDENVAKMYWVDMESHPFRQVNDLLSQSHRRAATVKLKFDFPFYGHKVRNITIATGGFLYTGEYLHNWLAATQYIAPLMANFDTRLSSDSWVKHADNGTAFTVEWKEVVLQDKPKSGGFTFQVTLHDNGNIVFVYSKIPLTVEAIADTEHPVKVGLSDAYIMDRTIFFVRRKTIYEYHRVNLNHQEIGNWTVMYLRALPTCLAMHNCNDCLTKVPEFDCKWCPELRQCSTGIFRFRQGWMEKGCQHRNIKNQTSCPATDRPYTENLDIPDHPGHVRSDAGLSASVDQNTSVKGAPGSHILEHPAQRMNMGVSGVIGVLLLVSLIAGLAAWGGYAYRYPHSTSGQMLIRYRPSQWSWRRGEARYTAATIHM